MKEEEIYIKLFQFSRPTYYKWKRENVPVIALLEKYFSKEELQEFLQTGSIQKQENMQKLNILQKKEEIDKNLFNFKLMMLSNSGKQLMIDQLNYCIQNNENFNIIFASEYYQNQFQQFWKQTLSLFGIKDSDNSKPDYAKKDREKYIFYIKNILNKDDIKYIDNHKEEIVEKLESVKGWICYASW